MMTADKKILIQATSQIKKDFLIVMSNLTGDRPVVLPISEKEMKVVKLINNWERKVKKLMKIEEGSWKVYRCRSQGKWTWDVYERSRREQLSRFRDWRKAFWQGNGSWITWCEKSSASLSLALNLLRIYSFASLTNQISNFTRQHCKPLRWSK